MKLLKKFMGFFKKGENPKQKILIEQYNKGLYLRVGKQVDNKELMENLKNNANY